MNNFTCFITIEDLMDSDGMHSITDELDLSVGELTIIDCKEPYLILKYECDDWGDAKDLCANLVVTLLELGITKFSLLYEGDEE